jgi:ABC-type Na+ efflux pump permease subunit
MGDRSGEMAMGRRGVTLGSFIFSYLPFLCHGFTAVWRMIDRDHATDFTVAKLRLFFSRLAVSFVLTARLFSFVRAARRWRVGAMIS